MAVRWKRSLVPIFVLVAAVAACRGSEPGGETTGAVRTTSIVPTPGETITASPAETPAASPGETTTASPAETPAASPSETPGTDGTTSKRDLTGSWAGTWVNVTPDGAAGTLELTWVQKGTALEGTITIEGTACLNAGTTTGSLSGRDVVFGVAQREVRVDFTGTVSGDTMSGTYSSINCDGAAGNWQADKIG